MIKFRNEESHRDNFKYNYYSLRIVITIKRSNPLPIQAVEGFAQGSM